MAKGTFKRVGTMIIPVGREGQDALFAQPENKPFIGEFRTARNPELHELYWALCELLAEATDCTKRACSDWLLEATRYCDPIFRPDGSMKIVPRSIAWESMEEAEFRRFFDAAVPKMAELLGSAPKEIIARFNDMLDPEARARFRRRRSKRMAAS